MSESVRRFFLTKRVDPYTQLGSLALELRKAFHIRPLALAPTRHTNG